MFILSKFVSSGIDVEPGEFIAIVNKLNVMHEQMNEKPIGSTVEVGCRVCEGFEKHIKLSQYTWECQECKTVVEFLK